MQVRHYRNVMAPKDLYTFEVRVKETDLWIAASDNFYNEVFEIVLDLRKQLEDYICENPHFLTSLTPLPIDECAPPLIRLMMETAQKAQVGPMASVAGALNEMVGKRLSELSEEFIIENGGDIFIKTLKKRRVAVFAGSSPLSMRLAIEIPPGETVGVCTSSGTVGHSISFGKADAVCVISSSCTLADAVATALGNKVREDRDIKAAISYGKNIEGIKGILIIMNDKIGVWGNYKLEVL